MSDGSNRTAELLNAVLVQMLRKGVIDDDDLVEIAEAFEGQVAGAMDDERREQLRELAHMALIPVIEAKAPTADEWNAQKARERFRVVKGGEAGD